MKARPEEFGLRVLCSESPVVVKPGLVCVVGMQPRGADFGFQLIANNRMKSLSVLQ